MLAWVTKLRLLAAVSIGLTKNSTRGLSAKVQGQTQAYKKLQNIPHCVSRIYGKAAEPYVCVGRNI